MYSVLISSMTSCWSKCTYTFDVCMCGEAAEGVVGLHHLQLVGALPLFISGRAPVPYEPRGVEPHPTSEYNAPTWLSSMLNASMFSLSCGRLVAPMMVEVTNLVDGAKG